MQQGMVLLVVVARREEESESGGSHLLYSTLAKVFVIGQIVSQFSRIDRGAPPHFLLLPSAIKQVLKYRTLKRDRKGSRKNTEE